jgi:hypothetical protein
MSKTILNQESTGKLKSLLMTVGKGEIELENQRQNLGELPLFEPYAAFMRIDRNGDGELRPIELLNFLRDNGADYVNESDCYYIIRFYDNDENGKLNYSE